MIGGPPACATKLVKPEATVRMAPSQRGGGALSACGGNSRRCARNSKVKPPTMPATTCAARILNSSAPISVPSRPKGSRNFSSFLSKSLRSAAMPSRSMSSSTGIRMAAACGTLTASAISGTASEPKPAPKPLLLMPSKSTAGTDTR